MFEFSADGRYIVAIANVGKIIDVFTNRIVKTFGHLTPGLHFIIDE